MALFDLARMTVSSSGTGTITLNAAVSGFLTFDLAGCSTAATGQAVTYAVADTAASEIGSGTYTSSSLSLTRGPVHSTNGNNAINMNATATVLITPQAKGIIGKINIQSFIANGTYTPTTGLITADMMCIGGGGGGGGTDGDVGLVLGAGGGGSGGCSRTVALSSTIGTSQTVTIGAGGAGGAAGFHDGAAGSDTSIGVLCIGKGGSGGKAAANLSAPTGGAGGVAGTGTITPAGNPGSFGFYSDTVDNVIMVSGNGGNSYYGPGAQGAVVDGSGGTGSTAGAAASANTGGGGSGGAVFNDTNTVVGGNGGSGIAIVTEYCSL